MSKEQEEYIQSLAETMKGMSDALQHHQFVLQAVTATLKEHEARLPRESTEPEPEEIKNEARMDDDHIRVATKLPEGFGSLLISIDRRTGTAVIESKNIDHRDKAKLNLRQARR